MANQKYWVRNYVKWHIIVIKAIMAFYLYQNVYTICSWLTLVMRFRHIRDCSFLPFVDHILDREALNQSARHGQITAFFNSWWGDGAADWPPPDNINPILTSIHVDPPFQAILRENVAYLRDRAPVGCRDSETCKCFNEIGVQSYFSTCLTLMLQNPHYHMSHTDNIYLVDVSDDAKKLLPQDILDKAIIVQHTERGQFYMDNAIARYVRAYHLLELYATAKLVITQRIHCALPSKAMGTPVVLINSPNMPGGDKHHASSRVVALEHFFHTIDTYRKTEDEIRNWTQTFDWNNPPANPDPGRLMRVRSTFWNIIRQQPNLYDSSRKFGLLPLTSIPDEINGLTFHLMFTTTKADGIAQYQSTTLVSGTFNWLNMRVVESFFYHHPFARVIVHSNTLPQDQFDVFTETGYIIKVQSYDLLEMLRDSPAPEFITKKLEKAQKGQHWYSHQSDLLRLQIMYKYGGIYMDTDMILVKPVDMLGPNILAYELDNWVNGAFMKFERRHKFIEDFLAVVPQIYNPEVWVTIGPGLLSHVWGKYQNANTTHKHLQSCFHDTGDAIIPLARVVDDQAYGVHLNSKISGVEISKGGPLKEGTLCKRLLNDFCILCNERH